MRESIHKYVFLLLFINCIHPTSLWSSEKYDLVDQHAMNVELLKSDNLLKLTYKLVNPFRQQEEKARAIFCWIAHNVEYDVQALQNKQGGLLDPEEIIIKKKAICGGYALLFKAMIESAGMECEIITGHSKGYGYELGNVFVDKNLHAWNSVKINDEWRLVDATWGAGYIDENSRFNKSYNTIFFLTDPEILIQSHYPKSARWQLLKQKVTKKEFENFVHLSPTFFEFGLTAKSHLNYKIEAKDPLLVEVLAAPDIDVIARLSFGETSLNTMYTFTQRKDSLVEINVVFPETANYILSIFAKTKDNLPEGQYALVLSYSVEAKVNHTDAVGFPEIFHSFNLNNNYLFYPFKRFLTPKNKVSFKIQVDEAEEVVLFNNNIIVGILDKSNQYFSGEVLIPEGEIILAAKYPGKSVYEYLLKFDGWKP